MKLKIPFLLSTKEFNNSFKNQAIIYYNLHIYMTRIEAGPKRIFDLGDFSS